MKTKFLLLALLGLLYSCAEEGSLTEDVSSEMIDEQTVTLQKQGVFTPTSGITVNGSVKIFLDNDQNKLELVDFSISNGPDLKVYLSKSNTPTEFVNLGNLNPATIYSIPKDVDLKQYPFVLIHCQQYNHLFAVAELIQK
ncbi:MAG: DM13 domain-containing protein [Flavobacterium sp.]|nr:DM13 domain-containing protein [Flavobacterium sp.]